MPVIIGHSQVKYFAEYMDPEEYTVFAYPGYRTRQFLEEDVLKTVLPFHSVVVLVVGANDIGRGNPERVMTGIEELSEMVRQYSPSNHQFYKREERRVVSMRTGVDRHDHRVNNLVRDGVISGLPPLLEAAGLRDERKHYLYQNVRPYLTAASCGMPSAIN